MFVFTSVSVFANPNSGYDITDKVRINNENDMRIIPVYPNPNEFEPEILNCL